MYAIAYFLEVGSYREIIIDNSLEVCSYRETRGPQISIVGRKMVSQNNNTIYMAVKAFITIF